MKNLSEIDVKSMDLFEFIRSDFPNSYVKEFGFKSLYVRNGYRLIFLDSTNAIKVKTIDLARIEVELPGAGIFTRLIDAIQINFPNLVIYVECVQKQRFRNGLIRLGFHYHDNGCTGYPSYFLEPLSAQTPLIQGLKL